MGRYNNLLIISIVFVTYRSCVVKADPARHKRNVVVFQILSILIKIHMHLL